MTNLGPNFYPKLVQMSSEVGMKPEDLIAVMVSESGMNPGATEKRYKATGLIQLMPSNVKKLGFNGNYEDFGKLSGEEQLDYIKKYIEGNMQFNGQPFTSAAQYYVANFWPVGLKLAGVKQGDPNTPIVENNPERSGPGNKFSKKYYDLGIKISADYEHKAYQANPLFDHDKKGAITYGDMMKQIEINKQNPIYRKTIAAMQDQTGYQVKENPSMLASNTKSTTLTDQNNPTSNLLDKYLQLVAASEKKNKKLYKQYLTPNNGIIKIIDPHNNDHTSAIEYAKVLSSVLDEELLTESSIHSNKDNVEIQFSIFGPSKECFSAIKELSSLVSESFYNTTNKIGNIFIIANVIANKTSSYQEIDLNHIDYNHRKFLIKFAQYTDNS